jgi:iron complex outermembrane receptor protein
LQQRSGCLATAALAVILPLPALAQSASPAQSGPAIQLNPVTVTGTGGATDAGATAGYQPKRSSLATGTDAPLLDVPQAVNVVPSQVLQDQGVRTLDEALYNVSGITQTNTLGSTQDAFIRRGFGDNRDGSVMRDGLRTALPRSFTAAADRVEVLKGPATMLYGIIDPGGLVNVVSKKPEQQQQGSASLWGTSFGGGGGSFDITGPISSTGLAYRVIGDIQDTDYWRNFGVIRQTTFAPSVAWYGESTTLRFAYEHTQYKEPFDRGTIFFPGTSRAVNTPRERRFDEPFNVTQGGSDLFQAEGTHRFNQDWSVRFNYAYSHNWYKDNQARVTAFNGTTGVATRRSDATQDSNVGVHAVRADTVGHFTFAGLGHELLFGTAYDYSSTLRTNLIRSATNTNFNIYNPIYGRMGPSSLVVATDSDQTEKLATSSVYLQDSVSLTEQWILVGGLRYQYYEQMAGRGRPFNRNTDVEGDEVTPRIGLVYKVTPEMSLYAGYSQSFKPNSQIAVAIGALPPEKGESYEAGVKLELARGISATAAVFDIVKENVLYSEVVNGVSVNRTAGEVRSRGFEIDVAGQITPDWMLIASYGYTDVEVLKDPVNKGKSLANVAKHTASLFVTHDFGTLNLADADRLRAGVGGRYVGDRQGDAAGTFTLPDYTVVDAFVAYTLPVKDYPVTLQLNVKNLFDKTYYTSAVNNLGVQVGEPLQAIMQAKVVF